MSSLKRKRDNDGHDEGDTEPGLKRPTKAKTNKKQKKSGAKLNSIMEKAESIQIPLPSSCPADVQKRDCLRAAVLIEISLRKKQADSALDLLRSHLITSYSFREQAKKNKKKAQTGRNYDLRSQSKMIAKNKNVRRAAAEYRRQHAALKTLGASDDDYPELAPTDVKAFTVRTQDQELGDSKKGPSWIWQKVEFVSADKLSAKFVEYTEKGEDSPCTISMCMLTQIVVMKVHWFRMSALKSRWEEEDALVIEEMKRCTRFFKRSHHDWLLRGDAHEREGQHGYAAYARKCVRFVCI